MSSKVYGPAKSGSESGRGRSVVVALLTVLFCAMTAMNWVWVESNHDRINELKAAVAHEKEVLNWTQK